MSLASIIRRIIPKKCRPIGYYTNQAWAESDGKVRAGPFAGMLYGQGSFGSCYIPKVLGIYERECYDAIEWACALKPAIIVDVGAAEGYYAVGLCRRNPQASVIAFEMEEQGRKLLQELVTLNGCQGRLQIRGTCDPAALNAALGDASPSLVVCDCEGNENTILNPEAVPALRRAMIFVELHDVFEPGTGDRLKSWFASSHEIQEIWSQPRDPSEYPYQSLYTRLLPKRYRRWAVDEWRPGAMSWLWMRPKGG
jgi:hypothetical protein